MFIHEHQVLNPGSNLDHNPHGRGGLSLDLNPVCLRVCATNPDQDLDQNPRVNGAIATASRCLVFLNLSYRPAFPMGPTVWGRGATGFQFN